MRIQLGFTYTDCITGYQGVATAHCEYLTGCNQTLLIPKCEHISKRPEGEWFDDQRLSIELSIPRIVIENGSTPGCDAPAPKR